MLKVTNFLAQAAHKRTGILLLEDVLPDWAVIAKEHLEAHGFTPFNLVLNKETDVLTGRIFLCWELGTSDSRFAELLLVSVMGCEEEFEPFLTEGVEIKQIGPFMAQAFMDDPAAKYILSQEGNKHQQDILNLFVSLGYIPTIRAYRESAASSIIKVYLIFRWPYVFKGHNLRVFLVCDAGYPDDLELRRLLGISS